MKNDNSKTPYDSYLESLERMRKSLMPLTKTLSEMTFDTSALTGAVGLMSDKIAEMWKGYEKVDVSKAALAVMNTAFTPLEVSESYKKSLEEMSKRFSAASIAEEYSRSFGNLQNIVKSLMSTSVIDTTRSIQNIQETMKAFTDSAISEQMSQLRDIDYGKIFSETLEANGTFKDAVDAAYESLQEENKPETTELETDFVSEQELQDAINDHINNPIGFQERVANWAAEKCKKYFIAFQLWLVVWGIFVQPYLQENVGLPATTYITSNVKELPQKGAKIVAELKENIEATIIENTNYYYKVTFIDENGVQREGYVAKRNLKIIDKPGAEETTEEEQPTEE